jgi:hypothetical protein
MEDAAGGRAGAVLKGVAGMTEVDTILSIVAGCAAIAFSFLVDQFSVGRIMGGPTGNESRPITKLRARLVFIVVGAVFILFGLKFFIFRL